jgi:hypothetical protein
MTLPCKDPDELSNGDLLEVVRSIQRTLWPAEGAPVDRSPLQSIEGILRDAGLGPGGFEHFVADDGDQCDSCGENMAENRLFLALPGRRVAYRFCCEACAETGVTAKSRKARFIGAVLGRPEK